MGSREKVDAFLNSIIGNNDEPNQNDGAPATAAHEPVSDKPFPPQRGAAETAIFSTSSRADGPDFLRFFLVSLPQQLFYGPAVDPNGAAKTRSSNTPYRERYYLRLTTEARSPGRKRDAGFQYTGESFTLFDVAKMLF